MRGNRNETVGFTSTSGSAWIPANDRHSFGSPPVWGSVGAPNRSYASGKSSESHPDVVVERAFVEGRAAWTDRHGGHLDGNVPVAAPQAAFEHRDRQRGDTVGTSASVRVVCRQPFVTRHSRQFCFKSLIGSSDSNHEKPRPANDVAHKRQRPVHGRVSAGGMEAECIDTCDDGTDNEIHLHGFEKGLTVRHCSSHVKRNGDEAISATVSSIGEMQRFTQSPLHSGRID
jgi:hypothetical protein